MVTNSTQRDRPAQAPTTARVRGRRRRYLAGVLTLLLGIAGSVAVFGWSRQLETDRISTKFRHDSEARISKLDRVIRRNLQKIDSVAALYAASEHVEPEEFRTFVDVIARHNSTVRSLVWLPRVSAAQREAFETQAAKSLKRPFRITQRDASGTIVAAGSRPYYFPILYHGPTYVDSVTGHDAASDPVRLQSVEAACRTGRLTASGSVPLLGTFEGQPGLLVFLPVYRKGAVLDSPESRTANVQGVIEGVFHIRDLIEQALPDQDFPGIVCQVQDQTDPDSPQVIWYRAPGLDGSDGTSTRAQTQGLWSLRHEKSLSVAGRSWVARCTATRQYVSNRRRTTPWLVAGLGILLTVFLAHYLFGVIGRTCRVEAVVAQRTGQLSRANEDLLAQIAQREQAEELMVLQRDLAVNLGSTGKLDIALDEVLRAMCRIEGIDSGGVYLVSENTEDLYLFCHHNLSEPFVAATENVSRDSKRAEVIRRGKPVYIERVQANPEGNPDLRAEGLRSVAVIPITDRGGNAMGSLNLGSHTHDEVSPVVRRALETTAGQISAVIWRTRSEDAMCEMFVSARDAIFWVAPETGKLLRWNRAAETLLQRPAEDLVDRHFTLAFPPERIDEYNDLFQQLVAQNGGQAPDIEILTQSGEIRFVDIAASLVTVHGRRIFQAILHDITDRKRAEARIEDLARFPHENPNPVMRISGDGVILFANELAEGAFHWSDGLPAPVTEAITQSLATGQRMDIEHACGGRVFDVLLAPIPSSGYVNLYAQDVTDRRAAEQALRKSEEKFRFLAEKAYDIFYSVDTEGTIQYVGPQVGQYGYETDEIVGRELMEFVVEEDREKVADEFQQTLATGKEVPMEMRIRARDGTVHWFEELGAVQRDADGQPVAVTGILRNIDERKAADSALRVSEGRFRDLFENSPLSLWEEDFSDVKAYLDELRDNGVTDLRAYFAEHPEAAHPCAQRVRIVDINSATLDLFEAPSKEALLGNLDRLLTPESANVFAEEVAALADGQPFEAETANLTLTGRRLDVVVHASLAPGSRSTWQRALVCIVDITQRRQAETALRDSEEKYRQLFQSETDAIILFDADCGHVIDVNPAAIALYGYPREHFLNLAHQHLTDTAFDDQMRQAMKAGFSGVSEQWHRKRDGSVFPVEIAGTRFDLGGRPVLCGVVRDIRGRKAAEQALRDSEEKYRTLVENVNFGVYRNTGGPHGRFLQANPAIVRIFGYDSVQEFMDIHVADLYQNAHDRQAFIEEIAQTGSVVDKELALKRKDGTAIWCSCTARVTWDDDGNVSWMDGVIEDITVRRAAQEALRESEEKYRALVESADDAIVMFDREGTFLFANTCGAQRAGFTVEEITGKTAPEVFPAPGGDIVTGYIHQVFDTGRQLQTEMSSPARRRDSKWLNVSMAPVHDSTGRVVAVLSVARDITERKAIEQALRDSEEKYRVLVENAGEAILSIDHDGRFLFANSTAAQRTRTTPGALIGKTMWEVFPKDVADRQIQNVRRVIDSGKGRVVESETQVGGEARWYSTSIQPICNTDGRAVSALLFARDVTERKQAEESLAESQHALQRAHRRLMTAREEERRHLAGELHDSVGQALVALQLSIRNTADRVGDGVDDKTVEALTTAAGRCTGLVKEVRQICHGLYPPTLSSLGLAPGLRQLAQECREAGFDTRVEIADDVATMRFEPDVEIALFRIAQEAVNNAIRHSSAEGITLDLGYHDSQVVLKIVDNGEGFDTTEALGNGLGLATMKERAQAVNGQLEINSQPRHTRITIVVAAQPVSQRP